MVYVSFAGDSIQRLASMQEHRDLHATSQIVEMALHELENFSSKWSFSFIKHNISELYRPDCLDNESNGGLESIVSILKHAQDCAANESTLVQVRRWTPTVGKGV